MMGLTRRQRDCLDAIKAHQEATGDTPSLAELARALGLASKSAACRLVASLQHRGVLKRIPGRARSIVLKNQKCPHCGRTIRGPR